MVKKDIVSDLCEYFLGVTTIAGGKSNVAGYRDGPSEDAKFSRDVLFGKSPLTRKIVIISLIQFPVQVYILILLIIVDIIWIL